MAKLGAIAVLGWLGLVAAGAAASAQQLPAGVTAGVNPTARGTPPAAATRTLYVGLDVLRNERIQTEAQGQVQIHFLDRSTLTIGPSADLVIDEFVYAPATEAGRFAMSTGRGLLRVVGGAISKKDEVTVTTPAAVIGIRGGVMLVETLPAEAGRPAETTATFLFGLRMRVRAFSGDEVIVRRPGFSVTVVAGQKPAAPKRETLAILDAKLDRLEGGRRDSAQAGAGAIRISALLEQSGLAILGSDRGPAREGSRLFEPIIPNEGTRLTPEIETRTIIDGFGETRRDAADHAGFDGGGGGGGGGGGPVTAPTIPTPPITATPPSTPTPPTAPN